MEVSREGALPIFQIGREPVPLPGNVLEVTVGMDDPDWRHSITAALGMGQVLLLPQGAGRTAALARVGSIGRSRQPGELLVAAEPVSRARILGSVVEPYQLQQYEAVIDPDWEHLPDSVRRLDQEFRDLVGRLPEEYEVSLGHAWRRPGCAIDVTFSQPGWPIEQQLRIFRVVRLSHRLQLAIEFVQPLARKRRRPAAGRRRRPEEPATRAGSTSLIDRMRLSGLSEAQLELAGQRLRELADDRREILTLAEEVPWDSPRPPDLDPAVVREALDRAHVGGEDVKREIMRHVLVLARAQRNDSRSRVGLSLLFIGEAGTGKTTLAEAIATALGRPFIRLNFGGSSEVHGLLGSHQLYVRASPGTLLSAFVRAKSLYPVVLLDEIDKIAPDPRQGDPQAALLSVLEDETFTDNYLQLPVPVRGAIWIAAANSRRSISDPLLDRFQVVQFPAYTKRQRIDIAKTVLLPRLRSDWSLSADEVAIPDETLQILVADYSSDAGLRQVRRQLERLMGQAIVELSWRDSLAAMKLLDQPPPPLVIGPEFVRRWLGE